MASLAGVLAKLTDWIDPDFLIETFGLIGIAIIVFAESGILVGLFLPGDSLLFTAGILAAADKLNILILVPTVFVAAALGDSVGYAFGKRAGPALYRRPNSRFFKQEHLRRATEFYQRRGGSTIVLARFVPIVRTLAPIVAGATGMAYRRFLTFNLIGAFLWGVGVTLAGYTLGKAIPSIDRYLLPIIAVVVALSLIPPALEILRRRRNKAKAAAEDGNTQPLD
ncbi:MAG: VTT domain-containing protein [Actinomycetota bacterium]